MNINQVFPSKYLKADEIGDTDMVVTIDRVEIEDLGTPGNKEQKPIVYFRETEKGLALNKTNANTISNLYGPETEAWIGKRIGLFATEVDFQGQQTLAIRVRLRAPAGGSAAPQAPSAGAASQPANAMAAAIRDAKVKAWNAYRAAFPTSANIQEDFKIAVKNFFPDKSPEQIGAVEWEEFVVNNFQPLPF